MAIQLLINCKVMSYWHTVSASPLSIVVTHCPEMHSVPTYISNDHEHQNGTINSSLVGVIIGDWKFYNHQGLCFNSKRSIRDGLMDITCGLMISQKPHPIIWCHAEDSNPALYSDLMDDPSNAFLYYNGKCKLLPLFSNIDHNIKNFQHYESKINSSTFFKRFHTLLFLLSKLLVKFFLSTKLFYNDYNDEVLIYKLDDELQDNTNIQNQNANEQVLLSNSNCQLKDIYNLSIYLIGYC
ncbi:hypothetical protein H8356DRAFT_1434017 [Neocallimastix lanati (nom. inval.)]|nr:hypothetical protein H8356DRAFT_1434017 [Neocallimastix sp. JGI-2020a]